jgi:WD40 repeat protein
MRTTCATARSWGVRPWLVAMLLGLTAALPAARAQDAADGQGKPTPLSQPLRHGATILAVAFSPDGKLLLTGSRDQTARLWDVETGKPVGPPLHHAAGYVDSVAFGAGGKTVLTSDGKLHTWDTATGKLLGPSLPLGLSNPGPVAFSPDRKSILVGSYRIPQQVRLFDAEAAKPIGPLLTEGSQVMAFRADGKAVFAGNRVWDAVTGRPLGAVIGVSGTVRTAVFSPDGKRILTGSEDGKVQFWDADTGRPSGESLAHGQAVMAVAFSPDGKLILTGTAKNPHVEKSGGEVRLWDAASGRQLGPPLAHGSVVRAVAFSPDGRTFVTAYGDGTARLWRLPAPQK